MKSKIDPSKIQPEDRKDEDRQATDILLYLDRCAQAVKNIPKPHGLNVQFQVVPLDGKAGKITTRAKEINDECSAKLEAALKDTDPVPEKPKKKAKAK